MDTTILDEIIIGRVEPHIYAFKTNTVPNYLKVGDTYRPVSERLKEWKKHFPDLQKEFENKATVNSDIFFRDFAVHQYLENELNKIRLQKSDIKKGVYYSNEFFKETKKDDIENAITDITASYQSVPSKYQYYKTTDSMPVITEYKSTGYWKPRPNQQEAINNFCKAVNSGRTNLLMYAVMRFGKSFTSMCCAKEMPISDGIKGAKIVLVVSAKADVKEEWKKTVQSADNFREYKFFDSERLKEENIITNTLKKGEKVVIFLTLQDLQGSKIKEKHKEVFENHIDLLIIDETHYGARAEQYGKVLNTIKYEEDIKDKYTSKKTDADTDDYINSEVAETQIKQLKAKVRLHLSGTPYRILMGSEFSKNDIITFCQFSDIVKEQEAWNKENLLKDVDEDGKPIKEWDNPYYGFPQMVRFAFNPSKSAQEKLQELKQSGVSYAFSALLKPKSIEKADNGDHKKFVFEKEVLELFEVIDGSKTDDNILGFLDYDKIKQGKMCQHIVCVLPYCASCDALEKLIKDNKRKFKNLNKYEIVNISGVEKFNLYKSVTDVKNKIKKCEKEGKKTLTLTVNRMLTGSTVEQWDTMIYLKDTSSPQEYDQAIFRLQNQYIKKMEDNKGEEIKYNMKPQTLLVDFDPHRMFIMQEMKSQIYNANVDERGNSRLKERLEEDLKISPIIVLNQDKISKVEPSDILNAISQYSKNRSVIDEARDIPIDLSLLKISEIKYEIEKQGELGSNQGFTIDAVEGDDIDLDTPTESDSPENPQGADDTTQEEDKTHKDKEIESIKNKFRTYYSRILFFSFLSKSDVSSLDDVVSVIDEADNIRISNNLGLQKNILILLKKNINVFVLQQLDYKIQNINKLANDLTLEPVERAIRAINKFNRLSASEVTTPQNVCDEMIALLPDESFIKLKEKDVVMLDIASKAGEYAIAIYNRCKQLGIDISLIKNSILSIPTSKVAYEFTRRIYEVLGLNTDCIAEKFTSYDLLQIKKVDKKGKETDKIDYQKISDIILQNKKFNIIQLDAPITKEGEKMKIEAVVGNPPYQEETRQVSKTNGQNPRTNIFQLFQEIALTIASSKSVLIYPGIRWIHRSGKGLKQFGLSLINNKKLDKLIFYPDAKEIFDNSGIADGISIVLLDQHKTKDGFEYQYRIGSIRNVEHRANPGDVLFIVNPQDLSIATKIEKFVHDNNFKYLSESILPRSLFGIESDFIEKNIQHVRSFKKGMALARNEIKLLTNDKSGSAGRSHWFVIDRSLIHNGEEYIKKWQVVVSSAHPGGQEGRDNQMEIIDNRSAFGRARVALKSFDNKNSASNFFKYCNSKIIRYSFLLSDESLTSLGKFVPDIGCYSNNLVIDFSKNIDQQLKEKMQLSEEDMKYIEKAIDKPHKNGLK